MEGGGGHQILWLFHLMTEVLGNRKVTVKCKMGV